MATSPFKISAKKKSTAQSSQRSSSDSLSLSQALTITAGLAGLIGLCSGVIIRFSLANSPKARFLSPLQTFPTLSNWNPDVSQDTADNRVSPSDIDPNAESFGRRPWSADSDSADSNSAHSGEPEERWIEETAPTQIVQESIDRRTFDAFANRREEVLVEEGSPWKRLEAGPQLGRSVDKGDLENRSTSEYVDDSYDFDSNYYEKAYDNPKDEPQYEFYGDESYGDEIEAESYHLETGTDVYLPEGN